ncbi:hypothetical protein AB0K21_43505 [Streptosporangium sp. NPDC049248]|uniref:hypothetical protein n=1 Tax=Streptosporangium sp. NPDC049248 TaxID=3155651 RepID=UPI00342D58C2
MTEVGGIFDTRFESKDDDFVGVQTYTRMVFGPNGPIKAARNERTFQTGWEYYPQTLGHAGYAMNSGLVSVDRETFARTPKPSLHWLGRVAATNGAHLDDGRP